MNAEKILVMSDVEFVGGTEETLAKRKVLNRVEDVGLAGSVQAHKTIDILRKQQVSRLAILEVRQFEFVEIHG